MTWFRTSIGLMSGTSLDGVDVALLVTDGDEIAEFGASKTYPYAESDRALLRCATLDAVSLADRNARPGALAQAEALVTRRHAEAVEAFLRDFGIGAADIDLVGFHGQTVFHDPARALTVQLGAGQDLADRLSIATVWDFRANDVAAGGQGAPLAPVFHRALAAKAGLAGPVVFLNLGGVANITYVGPGGDLVAFDTGPANSLLDDWTRARLGQPFDAGGRLAARGSPSAEATERLLSHAYFSRPPPKSLDRNAFADADLSGLSDADGAATLVRFTALAVAAARRHLPAAPTAWYVSGGGRMNDELVRVIRETLDGAEVQSLEMLGFDGDATEAQAFAFLAVRSIDGKPLSYPMTTGVPRPLSGGRLSQPGKQSLT